MGGEDFAYFAQRVPGLMVRLGIYNEAVGSIHSGHSARFRLDEARDPHRDRDAGRLRRRRRVGSGPAEADPQLSTAIHKA